MDKFTNIFHRNIKTVFFIFIAVFIFCLWQSILNAPFVFDDIGNIKYESAIQIDSLSFASFQNIITKAYAKNRPLANLTLALNWYFGKENTFGYHLVNLIIHWLASVFLFLFLQELFSLEKAKVGLEERYIKYLPYIITLLWLSSPLQTQSVTYIVQRMTSMAGMFLFLSLFFYAKGRRLHERYLYLLAVLSWIVSLLCKEITIVLPFIIILYEWIIAPYQRINKKKTIKYILLSLILVFLFMFFYSLLSKKNIFFSIFLADFSKRGYTMTQRVMTQWRVVIFYISLLLLPLPSRLNIDHDVIASTGLFSPLTTILSLITIIGLLYLAYKARTKHPLLSFGIFWYFLTLVIESSILNLELIFEHRLYIPSLGFWLVMVCLVMYISQAAMVWCFPSVIAKSEATCLRATHRQAKQSPSPSSLRGISPLSLRVQRSNLKDVILISIFILIFTGQSYAVILRNRAWQSELALWEDAVKKSPKKARSYFNLGAVYYKKGWYGRAIEEYKRALRIKPDYAQAYYNLGVVYNKKGWHDQAIIEYKKLLEVKPDCADAYYNLGVIYSKKGWYDQAIEEYKQALRIKPDYAKAYHNLGLIYDNKGWYDQAIEEYKQALRIKPDYAEVYHNLGVVYDNKGRYDQAIALYKEALKISPDLVKTHHNLGVTYYKRGWDDQAVEEYEQVLRIKPDYADAHCNLALIYGQRKEQDKAIYHLEAYLKYETNEERKEENKNILRQLITMEQ